MQAEGIVFDRLHTEEVVDAGGLQYLIIYFQSDAEEWEDMSDKFEKYLFVKARRGRLAAKDSYGSN